MKYRYFLLGLAALAVSCSIEEVKSPEKENNDVVFYATIDEQPDAATKVYADDQLRVLWNEDDRITIFSKFTYNQEYRFLGEDGDNAGAFRKVPNDDYVTGNDLLKSYAIYPYLESTKISNDGVITFTLPSEQIYHQDSFGIGANTMVSASETNELRFKNVGGYLSLKFYGEGVSISSIALKGNNGELLAGKCSIDMSSGLPVLTMDEGRATDTITLVCDPALDLGNSSSEAIAFWFVLPPVTFTKGITVTVTTSDGGVFEKSTSNKLEIGRSAITKLGALEVVPEYAQPNNVIYYTSTDGEIVTPNASDVFGVAIISNKYINGQGIITFNGEVTGIGNMAFDGCQTLSAITLPESITRIGDNAFRRCSGLVTIEVPAGVISIGSDAFQDCSNLESYTLPEELTDFGAGVFSGCTGLTSVITPKYVVPYGMFSGCSNLCSVVIPEGVDHIASYAFRDCISLSSITLPSTVKGIVFEAFSGCTNLVSITIPENVNNVYFDAFYGCTGLTSIYVLPLTPPSGGSNMFYGSSCPIYVPAESVEAYRAAEYWSEYADRIQAIPSAPVPEAIDLGLSVKWASFNIGASAPEEVGYRFAWGETEPKNRFLCETYKWCDGTENSLTKYNSNSEFGAVDNKTTLDEEDDAAHVLYGGHWRMPTRDEANELYTYCEIDVNYTDEIVTFTSMINGNTIVFPMTSYRNLFVWTKSLSRYSSTPVHAAYISDSSNNNDCWETYRWTGANIRAVLAE